MAVTTYFVNISQDYSISANYTSGSESNPLDWSNFINFLDSSLDSVENRVFRVKGSRGISENVVVSDTLSNYNTGNSLELVPWDDGGFWDLTVSASSPWGFVNGKLGSYPFKSIEIQNLRITNDSVVGFEVYNPASFVGVSIHFNNCWIRSNSPGYIYLNDFKTARFNNGNLIVNSPLAGKTLQIGEQVPNTNTYLVNSILTVDYFKSGLSNQDISASINIDNCTFKDSSYTKDPNISVDVQTIQYGFNPPAAISADFEDISPSDIDYVESGFSAISLSGNSNYTNLSTEYDVSGGTRDGIGALYFKGFSPSAVSAPGFYESGISAHEYGMSAYEASYIETLCDKTFVFDNDDEQLVEAGNYPISASHTYSAVGSYNPFVRFTSPNKWYTSNTDTFNVNVYGRIVAAILNYEGSSPEVSTGDKFVNINSSYDSTTEHTGGFDDPYDFSEFLEQIKIDGLAKTGSTFKLKGYREIHVEPSLVEQYGLRTDPAKSFTIDSWTPSANGPWMMAVVSNTTEEEYNPVISFAGSTIKGGIIYDIPSFGNGCKIEISVAKNCWINLNGSNSGYLKFYPTSGTYNSETFSDKCYVLGCNVFALSGCADNNQSNEINIIDSSFYGLSNKNDSYFSASTINISNSITNSTSADIEAEFDAVSLSANQYNFTYPDPHPFSNTHVSYRKTPEWLLQNKNYLLPFSGILAPPNPGANYPEYDGYSTGILGHDRSAYQR